MIFIPLDIGYGSLTERNATGKSNVPLPPQLKLIQAHRANTIERKTPFEIFFKRKSPYQGQKYHIRVRSRFDSSTFGQGMVNNSIRSTGVIVYYAPREEKTWTARSSCKLPPEPKVRVANTRCGLANFITVVRMLFFAIPGPKTPHSRSGAGRE